MQIFRAKYLDTQWDDFESGDILLGGSFSLILFKMTRLPSLPPTTLSETPTPTQP